jgi:CRP/FNR family cyclic AMP-dependent transcriptional regulator
MPGAPTPNVAKPCEIANSEGTKLMIHPIDRFEGADNAPRLLKAVLKQELIAGDAALAQRFIEDAELTKISEGDVLIQQGDWDATVYLILAGSFSVEVNGRHVGVREPGVHVGEIADLDGGQKRTATVTAREDGVVLSISENAMDVIRNEHPQIWEPIAKVQTERLKARNAMIGQVNEIPKVLVISSGEQLKVARHIEQKLDCADVDVTVWDQGVFALSDYPISSLTDVIGRHDFTIAVVAADDQLVSRGEASHVPRDNVQLEYGISVGMLGRERSLLLVDSDDEVKLASDQAGLTTLRFRGSDLERTVRKACIAAHKHISDLGPLQDRSKAAT